MAKSEQKTKKPRKKRPSKPRVKSLSELSLYNPTHAPEPLYVGKLRESKAHLKELDDYLKSYGVSCVKAQDLCLIRRGSVDIVMIPDKRLWDNMVYSLKVIACALCEDIKDLQIRANPAGHFRQIRMKGDNVPLMAAKLYIKDEADKYSIGFGGYGHFVEMDAGLYRRHWGPEANKLGQEARK